MAYVAADRNGEEWIYGLKPIRGFDMWEADELDKSAIPLPQNSIKRLTGQHLSWLDEPVELK